MTKKKYDKFRKEGFAVEEDGHFTVNYLPIIEGFTAHAVKKFPSIDRSQWVEVIHRNGERDFGPAECFSWGLMKCHPNDREEYHLFATMKHGTRKWAYDFIDLEITHYRLVNEPPASWIAGMPFPTAA